VSWWGKVVGGAFGFVLGGPLGAVLGAALGHQIDERVGDDDVERERTQLAFFTATFSVMGRVAKVDGRVTEPEIAFARSVMDQMSLREEQRRVAIRLFTEGKAEEFPLHAALDQFRREAHRRQNLLQIFLEIQIQEAYSDGVLKPAERDLLLQISGHLGFTPAQFEHLDALVRFAREFGPVPGAGRQTPEAAPEPRDKLRDAYLLLDVAPAASDEEVKRAYRRLMNQHHPDKLVAKGLPEEMVKLATEKTQEIKSAYEMVKTARGMK
jgi:DnaJ like chaperone protein